MTEYPEFEEATGQQINDTILAAVTKYYAHDMQAYEEFEIVFEEDMSGEIRHTYWSRCEGDEIRKREQIFGIDGLYIWAVKYLIKTAEKK